MRRISRAVQTLSRYRFHRLEYAAFAILEYSGLATSNSLDAVATAQGTGTVADSGNATTTASGDLLFGAILTSDARDFTAERVTPSETPFRRCRTQNLSPKTRSIRRGTRGSQRIA